jgi:hypothetical protein
MRGFPLQDEGPGMNEMFHDLAVAQEEERAMNAKKAVEAKAAWHIWVYGYGVFAFEGTEAEAEDMRARKAHNEEVNSLKWRDDLSHESDRITTKIADLWEADAGVPIDLLRRLKKAREAEGNKAWPLLARFSQHTRNLLEEEEMAVTLKHSFEIDFRGLPISGTYVLELAEPGVSIRGAYVDDFEITGICGLAIPEEYRSALTNLFNECEEDGLVSAIQNYADDQIASAEKVLGDIEDGESFWKKEK